MNTTDLTRRLLTLDEYLVFEETSDIRHEYVGGYLSALEGESVQHNQIAMNIAIALREAARGGPCRVFFIQVKCQVAEDVMYYPDIMVTCDPTDDDPFIVRMPNLVVEVLSPTTQSTDLREKWGSYSRLKCMQNYLVVSQDNQDVRHYWRDGEGVWQREDIIHRGTVKLPFLDVEMTLEEIYDGVF